MGAGPRSFPTGTNIIASGATGSQVAYGFPAQVATIVNAGAATSVAISVYNAATVGAAGAANRILNGVTIAAGQALPLNVYCNAGIVIQFGSATTDNITVTYQSLNNSA